MKKIITILLVIAMSLSFISCGKVSDIVANKIGDAVENKIGNLENEITESGFGVNQENENNNDVNEEDENDFVDDGSSSVDGIRTDYDLDNEVVVSTNDIEVTIKSLKDDGYGDFILKALYENKTDQTLTFLLESFAINGYMVDSASFETTEGGKKITTDIYIPSDALRESNIDSIDEIEFVLTVYDELDYDDIKYDEYVFVYPTGLDFDTVLIPNKPVTDNQEIIEQNELFDFTILDRKFDSEGNYEIKVFIDNLSEADCIFSIEGLSLNDFVMDPWFSHTVLGGFKKVSTLIIWKEDIEDAGIDSVDKMEFEFKISNAYDYAADPYFTETYVIE